MLENIKAVLFDLDGTLVDSMWMWKDIDIEYLGKRGFDLPVELQKDIEGMSLTETATYFKNRFELPESLEEIKKEWMDMARDKYCHQVPLKPGAKEFLLYLKEHQIRTGIASSNGIELVHAVLQAQGVDQYLDSVHTCCDVKRGKPNPDIYLLVAEELDVKPEECLVFEDIPMGILAGKRAGMRTCAVEDVFSRDQMNEKRRLADYYIQDYYDVLQERYEVLE
ncbi:MAG: HAD family phosphatase [Oliverpabstia sp.]|nr:HAD family phosphatase [Lachnospiraceae bacterium]MDY5027398.1 HAD family phosphatase [Oliverpabstia sp.]